MSILAPRYRRYAAWPVVIWCRLRGHSSGRFWSGTLGRCVECGDRVIPPEAIASIQRNVNYWGDRCCKVEAENKRLREALGDIIWVIEDKADVDDGKPNAAMRILTIARAAISSHTRGTE
jgi:hypothetical protein